MVAYSFKRQFVTPIRLGLNYVRHPDGQPLDRTMMPKRQTIRADRKRHARPGEELQLYRGMRTKSCFLIGNARYTAVNRIELVFRGRRLGVWIDGTRIAAAEKDRNEFARSEGFEGWAELAEFWKENHDDPESWQGVIIYWEPL